MKPLLAGRLSASAFICWDRIMAEQPCRGYSTVPIEIHRTCERLNTKYRHYLVEDVFSTRNLDIRAINILRNKGPALVGKPETQHALNSMT